MCCSVCALVREGLGVGVVNPLTAIDYVDGGVAIRSLEKATAFTSVLVLPPGKPLSKLAQQLLATLRQQLEIDLAKAHALTAVA
jgi:DNA-binding transcriptional LysR family regulator